MQKHGYQSSIADTTSNLPPGWRSRAPGWLKRAVHGAYWKWYDARDFLAELVGAIPSHRVRLFCYRRLLGVAIGRRTSIHRRCRFYQPSDVTIGAHSVINREVLLDGRSGLVIGENCSISEGVMILTLEHDPNSHSFASRGAIVRIEDRAFIGARALILPGVVIGKGAVVAAGAVVTKSVEPYSLVAGVPAKKIGDRPQELTYRLDYRKFLG